MLYLFDKPSLDGSIQSSIGQEYLSIHGKTVKIINSFTEPTGFEFPLYQYHYRFTGICEEENLLIKYDARGKVLDENISRVWYLRHKDSLTPSCYCEHPPLITKISPTDEGKLYLTWGNYGYGKGATIKRLVHVLNDNSGLFVEICLGYREKLTLITDQVYSFMDIYCEVDGKTNIPRHIKVAGILTEPSLFTYRSIYKPNNTGRKNNFLVPYMVGKYFNNKAGMTLKCLDIKLQDIDSSDYSTWFIIIDKGKFKDFPYENYCTLLNGKVPEGEWQSIKGDEYFSSRDALDIIIID